MNEQVSQYVCLYTVFFQEDILYHLQVSLSTPPLPMFWLYVPGLSMCGFLRFNISAYGVCGGFQPQSNVLSTDLLNFPAVRV